MGLSDVESVRVTCKNQSQSFCCVWFTLYIPFCSSLFILHYLECIFFNFSCFCFFHRYLILFSCFLLYAETLSCSSFIILPFLSSFSSAYRASAKMLCSTLFYLLHIFYIFTHHNPYLTSLITFYHIQYFEASCYVIYLCYSPFPMRHNDGIVNCLFTVV
jgi:hypothetical protein